MSTAEMEAKKLLLNAKEALIDEALKKAKEEYEKLKGKKEYKDALVKQVISSVMELDGKEFTVEVHEGDGLELTDKIVSNIEKETKKKGLKLALKEVSKDLGGVIVHQKGGKISVDNTFDSILERKKSEIRLKISGILFE
jgi:V/A-type H+-transporting ATPase subunit E